MIKQIVGLIFFALFLIFAKNAYATPDPVDSQKPQTQVEAKRIERRAKILAQYLKQFDSPLQNHAQDFIDLADKYGIDWKLVPAIAGVESTFGKFIPGGFNGWGWGVYGTQAIYFSSWREAIETITRGLKEKYIDRGLITPAQMNKIYAASPSWGVKVEYFMRQIEEFSAKYEAENPENIEVETSAKIAATSGQLAAN